MKKKISFIICGIFVFIALICMIIFVLTGKSNDMGNTEIVNLIGTWEVAATVENSIPTFSENQFITFNETKASIYKDNNNEPYAMSTYEITTDNKLNLPDISHNYVISEATNNCMSLYETKEKYMLLIRCKNDNMFSETLEKEMLIGRWNVIYRAGNEIIEESIEFSNETLSDYRNGSIEPFLTSEYIWQDDKTIFADKLNKAMKLYVISDNTISMVETDTGFVWELKKAE